MASFSSLKAIPLNLSIAICCWIVLGLWFIIYNKKMTRLQFWRDANEFCCCKGTTFILVVQEFGEKSDDLTGVFNSCWVFGDKKLFSRFYILEHKDTKKRRFYIVSSFSEKTLCIFVSLCLKLYQLNNYERRLKTSNCCKYK